METSESAHTEPDLIADIEASRQMRPGDAHRRAFVGPPRQYDFMGATQFRLLTSLGLRESDSLLDVGCGSLRAGRLLMPYLMPGKYFGIEPNRWLVDEAIEREIGRDLISLKRPQFSHNDDFDLGVFAQMFDAIVAQSIFSHTGSDLFVAGIRSIAENLASGGQALVTCIETDKREVLKSFDEVQGWQYPACVVIPGDDMMSTAADVGLIAQRLPWFHPRQTWFRLVHHDEEPLTDDELGVLGGTVLRDERFAG